MKQIFFKVKSLYARYFSTKGVFVAYILLVFAVLLSTPSFVIADEAKDLKTIEQLLTSGQGVEGSLHAVVPEHSIYVFAYMGESGFFEQVRLSLVPRDKKALEILKTLKRHDRVRVFGSLEFNNNQPHIQMKDIQLLKSWSGTLPPYQHEVTLPKDLENLDFFIGRVHAVHAGGSVVLLEYKDTVLPLVIAPAQLDFTKELFRGDKVKVHFNVAEVPHRPVHLEINSKFKEPVEVLDPVRAEHGKIHQFEGSLVMFPQSPQLKFNIFALQRDMGDGVVRDYTLIPKSFDENQFEMLRIALQATWDNNPEAAVNGRNKWIKKSIRIRARGFINVIDPNQANPQILFEDLKDIEIL